MLNSEEKVTIGSLTDFVWVNQKTRCLSIQKKKKQPCVGVEMTAGRDLPSSDKPGWSVGDMK